MDGDSIPLAKARDSVGDIVNRAAYGGERVVIERRGKPAAVVMSLADLEALEAFEAEADARAYREAKAAWEADGRATVSLETMRARHEAQKAEGR